VNTQVLSSARLPSNPLVRLRRTVFRVEMPHSALTIARLMTANEILTSYCLKQVNLVNTPVGEMCSY
jgi:hypothetical protein